MIDPDRLFETPLPEMLSHTTHYRYQTLIREEMEQSPVDPEALRPEWREIYDRYGPFAFAAIRLHARANGDEHGNVYFTLPSWIKP